MAHYAYHPSGYHPYHPPNYYSYPPPNYHSYPPPCRCPDCDPYLGYASATRPWVSQLFQAQREDAQTIGSLRNQLEVLQAKLQRIEAERTLPKPVAEDLGEAGIARFCPGVTQNSLRNEMTDAKVTSDLERLNISILSHETDENANDGANEGSGIGSIKRSGYEPWRVQGYTSSQSPNYLREDFSRPVMPEGFQSSDQTRQFMQPQPNSPVYATSEDLDSPRRSESEISFQENIDIMANSPRPAECSQTAKHPVLEATNLSTKNKAVSELHPGGFLTSSKSLREDSRAPVIEPKYIHRFTKPAPTASVDNQCSVEKIESQTETLLAHRLAETPSQHARAVLAHPSNAAAEDQLHAQSADTPEDCFVTFLLAPPFTTDLSFSERIERTEGLEQFRTVLITNLPMYTALADVVDVVRGGLVYSITLKDIRDSYNSKAAVVVFALEDAAKRYAEFARQTPLSIGGHRIVVDHIQILTPNTGKWLPIHARSTRCLRLTNLPKLLLDQRRLAEAVTEVLRGSNRVGLISYQRDADNTVHLGFDAIDTAYAMYDLIQQDITFKGSGICYEDDPCAQSLTTLLQTENVSAKSANMQQKTHSTSEPAYVSSANVISHSSKSLRNPNTALSNITNAGGSEGERTSDSVASNNTANADARKRATWNAPSNIPNELIPDGPRRDTLPRSVRHGRNGHDRGRYRSYADMDDPRKIRSYADVLNYDGGDEPARLGTPDFTIATPTSSDSNDSTKVAVKSAIATQGSADHGAYSRSVLESGEELGPVVKPATKIDSHATELGEPIDPGYKGSRDDLIDDNTDGGENVGKPLNYGGDEYEEDDIREDGSAYCSYEKDKLADHY